MKMYSRFFFFILGFSFLFESMTAKDKEDMCCQYLIPSFVEFSKSDRFQLNDTEYEKTQRLLRILRANEDISFVMSDSLSDANNGFHEFYKQFYKGVEIIDTRIAIHYDAEGNAVSYSGNGHFIQDLDLIPSLSEEEAKKKAQNAIRDNLWQEEIPSGESVSFIVENVDLEKIAIIIHDEVPHLVYIFNISSSCYPVQGNITVDAFSGEILIYDNMKCGITTHVKSLYSDSVYIETNYDGTYYELLDGTRGAGIKVCFYDPYYSNTYTWTDNNWNLPYYNRIALDIMWGAEKTYDFYKDFFSRLSYDNQDSEILCFFRKPDTYGAFWNQLRNSIECGSLSDQFWGSIDVVAHEFTHGVTMSTSRLNKSGESGALGEGLSDIFATCVENYAKPNNGYNIWLCAENEVNGGIRDMGNPICKYYQGENWVDPSIPSDNGGVHTNLGVFNYWFYLLVNGGSGTNEAGYEYSVTGIGLDDAIQICYLLNTAYLYPSANFTAARHLSVAAAQQLGYNSQVLHQIEEAWNAVGVPAMTIIGNSVLGQITTFSIDNLQEGANVSWSVVGSIPSGYTLQEDVPAVNQCMITRTGYSEFKSITLQATVSKNDTTVATLKKIVRRDSFAGTYKEVMRTNTFPPTMYTAIHPTTITNRNAIDVYPNGTVMLTSPYFTGKSISYQGGTPLYFSHSSNQVLFRIGTGYNNSPFTIVVSENGDDAEVRLHFYTLHPIFGLSILPIAERQFNISIDNDDMRICETESFSSDELMILNQAFTGMLPEQNHSMTDNGWILDVYDSEKGTLIMKKKIFESSYLLDADTWPSGLYILKATMGSETFTGKIRIDT